jgi:hypothetical protein
MRSVEKVLLRARPVELGRCERSLTLVFVLNRYNSHRETHTRLLG